VREQPSSKPADAADYRGDGDMHSTCVEAIRRVGECDGHDEANAPWWDGQELSLDRGVSETLDDRWREERETALRNDVGNLRVAFSSACSSFHCGTDLHMQCNAPAFAD
jgi:hypothetical protein